MATTPTPEAVERGRILLRRQGMADAACRLAATKFRPGVTVHDFGRALGLTGEEIQAALDRRRGHDPLPPEIVGSPAAHRPKPELNHRCGVDGCDAAYDTTQGLGRHRAAAHADPIPCPGGCGRIINAVGAPGHLRSCPGPDGHGPKAA